MTPAGVLHLTTSCFYGGPERQMLEQALRHDPARFRVTLSSFADPAARNEFLERARQQGVSTLLIPHHRPWDLRGVFFLRRYLREQGIRLLCLHGYKAAVMGWLAARGMPLAVLAFSRGYTTENRKVAFYEWLERQVLRRLSRIIAVSQGQAGRLVSLGIPGESIRVVHNAVHGCSSTKQSARKVKEELLAELGLPAGSRLVVSAGRLSPEKGHRFLVEAIGRMRVPADVFFVFCGEGMCRADLERRVARLGVAERCRFVGFRADVQRFYTCMEFLVLPSLTEGLPNVVLESFACGRPVVASRVGGVPELVVDGINGLLVEPGDAAGLAGAMEKMLYGPEEELREYGERGKKRVAESFTFERQVEQLENIYREELERCVAW